MANENKAEAFIESYHKNPYWCVDCGRKMLPCPARADGEDTYVGYHGCKCRSDDPFGHRHDGDFGKFPNQHPEQPTAARSGERK